MTAAKHTPGPWRLVKVESDSGHIVHLCPVGSDKPYSLLTTVEHNDVIFAAVYEDADARLIAAAPDLLESLQDLCDTLGECGMTEKARAAIAKATGVQE